MTLMLSTRGTCNFTSYPGLVFKEISHGECWKYHFAASRFQNFLGEDAPDPSPRPPPPYKVPLSTVIASFLYREWAEKNDFARAHSYLLTRIVDNGEIFLKENNHHFIFSLTMCLCSLTDIISRACLSRARLQKCRRFLLVFFVGGHQLGGHASRRSQRRPWKLGIRIVTTFTVYK